MTTDHLAVEAEWEARRARERRAAFRTLREMPADIRRDLLAVMKEHDGDNFHVGNDAENLAELLADLRRRGLEIVRRRSA
jgi:hypothetical protein